MARPQFKPRWKDETGFPYPPLSRGQQAWIRWLQSKPDRHHTLALRAQLVFCPNRVHRQCAWRWVAPPHHRYKWLTNVHDAVEARYLAATWLTDELVAALEAHFPNCPQKEVSS
jgi:hypothetical protein